jgi:hypothetical protein
MGALVASSKSDARRGFSQLDPARARTTQRHLSFIDRPGDAETEMICGSRDDGSAPAPAECSAVAAGYAPAWRERDFDADLLSNSALDYMLAQHEPYPAFVVDRR